MPITEKTRKILWARSGNRCAICRQRLVINETEKDVESVVGDECHIVSRAALGPRHDPAFPPEKLDDVCNLILLCNNHHKMVDDQFETYSAELLGQIKANHESWVEAKLKESNTVPPVRIRRFRQDIPERLELVQSGRQLLVLGSNCCGMYQHHDDHLSDTEVELVGGFLQSLRDYMDLAGDLEPIDNVRAAKDLDEQIKQLVEHGFLVFSAVERQRIEGGVQGPSIWLMLHVSVVRANDPSVEWTQPTSA
jgi:hypothetical protein